MTPATEAMMEELVRDLIVATEQKERNRDRSTKQEYLAARFGLLSAIRRVVDDAERYRWLRRKVCIIGTDHLSYTKAVFEFNNLPYPTHVAQSAALELDIGIDSARKEQPK